MSKIAKKHVPARIDIKVIEKARKKAKELNVKLSKYIESAINQYNLPK